MKRKKTADVSVRIYKDTRMKLKILAAKQGVSLASMIEVMVNSRSL
jgi:predicted HicB family RNase H-like nuclease